jgi:hypothetical protein
MPGHGIIQNSREVGGITKPGVHALSTDRTHHMGGIAAQGHPSAKKATRTTAARSEATFVELIGRVHRMTGEPFHHRRQRFPQVFPFAPACPHNPTTAPAGERERFNRTFRPEE